MKIAICDDINECVLSIKSFTTEFFTQKNVEYEIYEFTSGKDLISCKTNFDIIFLDIELGDINGIDAAKQILKRIPNTIILITTAYRKYLDNAMDLNVTRFIDKPITKERIFAVLEKALEVFENNILTLHTVDNKIIRLNQKDIIYIESKLKKVVFYTVNEVITVNGSLKAIRDNLSFKYFATPHNSFIVNLNYVREFRRESISLSSPYNDTRISVAPRKQAAFKRKYLDFIGENYI